MLFNCTVVSMDWKLQTTLVSSLTGDEGPEAFMFHKHVSQKMCAKTEENVNFLF